MRSQIIFKLASTGTATRAPMTPHIPPSTMIIMRYGNRTEGHASSNDKGTTPCQQTVISTK